MMEKKYKVKSSKDINSAYMPVKNDAIEEFEIPYEAACSAEFQEGCILRDDEE